MKAVKRLRYTRCAAVQREIDRLQEAGAATHETEIVALWDRKKTLLQLIAGIISGISCYALNED